MTDYSHQRDFKFCGVCRTMLSFNSPNMHDARCANSISRSKSMGRDLGMSSLDDIEEERELKQMDYNAKCRACQHLGLAYIARQIQSADEGQTIFYSCLVCSHKQTENS